MKKHSQLLEDLARQIRTIETSWHPQARSAIAVDIAELAELLPDGQLPAGALVELLSAAEGAGGWTLALLLARQACGTRRTLIVVDEQKSFYPPAAARLGIDLERTIVLRPAARRDVFPAIEQSLRCRAVGAVLGGQDRLAARDFRRLQRAAEMGGGLGLLLRPAAARREPSFATLRLGLAPVPSTDAARRLHVEVLRCPGGKTGQTLLLEIDDETGHVHLPARLASAAAEARAVSG